MAGEYLQRFATQPKLSATLKKLIDAYQSIATDGTHPDESAIKKQFWPDPPMSDEAKVLNEGAKQVIYSGTCQHFSYRARTIPPRRCGYTALQNNTSGRCCGRLSRRTPP